VLAFLAALFFLLITPGPGVLSTAGVGSAFGAKPGIRYVVGLCIGTNLVALAVVTGVAGLVLANPAIKTLLLYLSIAYLVYLALRIAMAGSDIAFIRATAPPGIINGILLQTVNPKAYVVNTTLFTGFTFAQMSSLQELLWKFVIINAVWIPIHILWLALGIGLQRLALPRVWQRVINMGMALSLLMVVLLALWHSEALASTANPAIINGVTTG